MLDKTYIVNLSTQQLDLLINVVRLHIEESQRFLSHAIYHEDASAISEAEASLRALDDVMRALKISL